MSSLPLTLDDPGVLGYRGNREVELEGLCANGDAEKRDVVAVLEELLTLSTYLRDLYRTARWQSAAIRHRHLRQLFDRHYEEQRDVVDVLIERLLMFRGECQIVVRTSPQDTRFAAALRGSNAMEILLEELLDAHDAVLANSRANGSEMNASWARDFAVGQVILTNDKQRSYLGDLFRSYEPRQRYVREQVPHCLTNE